MVDRQFDLFSMADAVAIEQAALDSGYRFEFSATISLESEPEKYRRPEAPQRVVVEEDTSAGDGRRRVGSGDNVVKKSGNVVGTVALVSTTEQVMKFLTEGVPEGTIAVIDDAGGTLTAPIIDSFAGVICLGGTVRSHLGILSREYGVPCLMNCEIAPLRDGDRVEIEASAKPPAADAYEKGKVRQAKIWKLEGGA